MRYNKDLGRRHHLPARRSSAIQERYAAALLQEHRIADQEGQLLHAHGGMDLLHGPGEADGMRPGLGPRHQRVDLRLRVFAGVQRHRRRHDRLRRRRLPHRRDPGCQGGPAHGHLVQQARRRPVQGARGHYPT